MLCALALDTSEGHLLLTPFPLTWALVPLPIALRALQPLLIFSRLPLAAHMEEEQGSRSPPLGARRHQLPASVSILPETGSLSPVVPSFLLSHVLVPSSHPCSFSSSPKLVSVPRGLQDHQGQASKHGWGRKRGWDCHLVWQWITLGFKQTMEPHPSFSSSLASPPPPPDALFWPQGAGSRSYPASHLFVCAPSNPCLELHSLNMLSSSIPLLLQNPEGKFPYKTKSVLAST